jgi:hypothetical protein
MQAFNRNLEAWFDKIRNGQLRLPRFQRHEAWERGNIVAVLDSVVRDLPIGSALVMEMGDAEIFVSRPLEGAPRPTERCTEHLLDGQQRLTALWKAFNGLYEDAAFFMDMKAVAATERDASSRIVSVSRWPSADGGWFPRWTDDPPSVHARGLVPVFLMKPAENSSDRQAWCDAAVGNDLRASRQLDNAIRELQDGVRRFNLPMLLLEAGTSRQTALDVFIRVNTRNEPLTAMDLVVAQLEARTGLSFAELIERLEARCPTIRKFGEIDQLALQAALLRTDKPPGQSYMFDLDLVQLAGSWDKLAEGMKWAIEFLEAENVFGERWLPTMVVVPVLSALHEHMPKELKARERAEVMVREYVWRAFVSGRYEFSSTSKALRDFRVIRNALEGGVERPRSEIFDPVICPVASAEEVARAGSPKRKDTLARAIMLLTLKSGVNLEDGSRITRDDVEQWDYRSIVPENLVSRFGGPLKGVGSNAVNCVLKASIPQASRSGAEIIPLSAYLGKGEGGNTESEDRIKSHLIPVPELRELIALTRAENVDKETWSRSFSAFLERRAGMIHEQMMKVVSG